MSAMPRSLIGRIRYVWVRAGVVVLLVMPIVMWAVFRPQGFDSSVLQSAGDMRVTADADALTFERDGDRVVRIMLLPGCPVDPVAYAPLARVLAQQRLPASIVRIPYRCAPLGPHEAELFERVQRVRASDRAAQWVLAGHSRGAVHALRIAARMERDLAGLVIIGSTHPREIDYSRLALPVLKISGSEDGVAPLQASDANRRLLPAAARWVVIDGGNHSQFAHYGFQLFDGRARISREEQQRQVAAAISAFVTR